MLIEKYLKKKFLKSPLNLAWFRKRKAMKQSIQVISDIYIYIYIYILFLFIWQVRFKTLGCKKHSVKVLHPGPS